MRRREFLAAAAMVPSLSGAEATPSSPYPPSNVIRGVRWLTEPRRYMRSRGDTWTCTWAADGNIYAAADDTLGIDKSCNSNLAIVRVEGAPPAHELYSVNCMAEYGRLAQMEGPDTWKANGLASVDGVLYLAVSRHSHAGDYPDLIQRVYDASIVKSSDYGKTWSSRPRLEKPMFPSPRFATPFFVQYGKDYAAALDEYVYAVSNGGAWDNGNYMVLGRVLRDRIGRLDAGDWELFSGTPDKPAWTKSFNNAQAIFRHRGYTSMAGMHWLPAYGRFILLQWAYLDLDTDRPFYRSMLAIYEAPKPWGPWRHVYTEPDWGGDVAYYNPSLPAKWFEDGGRRAWMVMAGNFNTYDKPDSVYCLTVQKLEFVG